MPRTAPTVGGTPTYVVVSFLWIDANGNLGSTPYTTTLARATDAVVEAMAVAVGAASNANVYDVTIELHYSAAAPSAAAATEAPRESVNDVILTLIRDPASRKTQEVQIPAPLDSLFTAGTNDVDPTQTLYQAVNTAANNLVAAAYGFISVRFSEHKKTNKKTRF